jgi:hypothetical protein
MMAYPQPEAGLPTLSGAGAPAAIPLSERLSLPRKALFSRAPVACAALEYEATLQRCVEIYTQYPGLAAIYQYGSVSAPGISDLDILLVFHDDTPPVPGPWAQHLMPRQRYLLMHSPTAIAVSVLRRGQLMADTTGLRLVWGDPIGMIELNPAARHFVACLAAADHSLRLLGTIVRQLSSGVVKQRPSLCELNSINYNLVHCPQTQQRWSQPFTEGIKRLRAEWFILPTPEREQQLATLLRLALAVEADLLAELGQWARQIAPGAYGEFLPEQVHAGAGIRVQARAAGDATPVTIGDHPLAALARYIPQVKLRLYLARYRPVYIRLDPILFALLRGDGAGLPKPYAAILAARRHLLTRDRAFRRRIGGDFGGLHNAPLLEGVGVA